jgi:serine protease Do
MWPTSPSRLPPEPDDVRLLVSGTGASARPRQAAQASRIATWSRVGAVLMMAVVSACASGSAGVAAQEVPRSREQIALSFAPIVREAAPAVVNIYTDKGAGGSPLDSLLSDPFFDLFFEGYRERRPQGHSQHALGSGVIVRDDGLIVTNHHVIEQAQQIMVVLSDRREYRADVMGDDETAD